jgi:hypothetical protein
MLKGKLKELKNKVIYSKKKANIKTKKVKLLKIPITKKIF